MSIDDIVYDSKKHGNGMVDKIILNKKGKFETETIMNDGSIYRSDDNDIVPILDSFIEKNPGFSNNGAKATLAVTGWEGILGYRISSSYTDDIRKKELEELKPVLKRLKETGWNFASHSYGHYHPSKISDEHFISTELEKWEKEIGSVIGDTNVYIYPFGEVVPQGSVKFNTLEQYGFYVLCGVCQEQEWYEFGNTLYMSRYSIDGITLSSQRDKLMALFDTNNVYDLETRNLLN